MVPNVAGDAVKAVEIEDDAHWNALLESVSGAELFHTGEWLRFLEEVFPVRAVRLGLEVDGQLVAGIPFLLGRRGPFMIAGSPFMGHSTPQVGPIARDPRLISPMLAAFDAFLQRHRVAFSQVICSAPVDPVILTQRGYHVDTYKTPVLDLRDRSAEEIFKGFTRQCRTAVRKAEREGVTIEVAEDPSYIAEYLRMAGIVYAKHRLQAPVPARYHEALWRHFHPSGALRVLIAQHRGRSVAIGQFLRYRDQLYHLLLASDSDAYSLRANNLMQWSIIQWAVENGIERYDMVGAGVPEIARFKQTFGSEIVEYPRGRRGNSPLYAAVFRAAIQCYPMVRSVAFQVRRTS